MQDAIENRIGERWLAEILMPMLDGQLAGDDGGSGTDAIVEDFQQIGTLHTQVEWLKKKMQPFGL